jgi:hypothetical protein
MMAATKKLMRHEQAGRILESGISPINKVQKLVSLGYEEEMADIMVSGTQVGPAQSMYYEQLPAPDYADDLDPR